jgi:hypothetical protein
MVDAIFEVADYAGDLVRLDRSRFEQHIVRGHPEMNGGEDAIRTAIEDPTFVVRTNHLPSHPQGERRTCYRRGADPRHPRLYVVVPIEYSPSSNWVVTAHLSQVPPSGEVIYVRSRL